MKLITLFVLLLCAIKTEQWQAYRGAKFNSWKNSQDAPFRVLELMRSYYEESNVRIAAMNDMRFMYEESPFYEQGYIIGEIIERFRKLVEHAKRPFIFESDSVPDTLKRVELVQMLYFELYHLVRMMHETPKKWGSVVEFMEKPPGGEDMGLAELYAAQNNILKMQQRREKQKRKNKKMYDKLRQAYLKGLSQEYSGMKKGRYNRHWPLDYGWEIDYDW